MWNFFCMKLNVIGLPPQNVSIKWLQLFLLFISNNSVKCLFCQTGVKGGNALAQPLWAAGVVCSFGWKGRWPWLCLCCADDAVSADLCLLPQLSVMEDLWRVAAGVFQVWVFVVLFLIMLPAMFGVSLGVTGVYIQILVRILEVTEAGVSLSECGVWTADSLLCSTGVNPVQVCLCSYEMCSRRHRVTGHLNISVFAVGHGADPERTARAAQRARSSVQRWVTAHQRRAHEQQSVAWDELINSITVQNHN